MPVGALIAGGLGAAGAIGSSFIQSSAAKSAAQAQQALGQQALGVQQSLGQQGLATLMDMFNQAKGIVSPVIAAGGGVLNSGMGILNAGQNTVNSVLPTLKALLTPGANMTGTLSQIPGFSFAQDWGQKAVTNIGTTTGLGGNTLKAGADYATGVAQQGWQGIVDRLLGTAQLGNQQSQVGSGVVSTGGALMAQPASALAYGAINTGNSAFSNLNTLGGTIGGTLTGIGNASAAGTLGSANAIASGLTGATGAGTNALFLSKLLGGGGGLTGNPAAGGIYGPGNYDPLTGLAGHA